MPTLPETFASYVPSMVARRYAAMPGAAVSAAGERFPAALLFADISGFTALAERLAQRGPAGAEDLSTILNDAFGWLVATIAEYGGDTVKFAGDALLALWPADAAGAPNDAANPSTNLALATCRAAQCALALQETLRASGSDAGGTPLFIRVGVGAGEVSAMHLGGVYGRWELLLAGDALLQTSTAAQHARPGEVVLAPAAWELVRDACVGTPLSGDEESGRAGERETLGASDAFSVSPALPSSLSGSAGIRLNQVLAPPPRRALQPPPLPAGIESALRAYIPGAILSGIVAGQTAWLAELRRVTVLFVNLPDLDGAAGDNDSAALERAQTVMRALQTALYRYEGSVNKISVDEKGVTLVAALGLPPLAHEDDAVRGVQAALAMAATLREFGMPTAIGVTSGRAFCGEVGSVRRREYTLIGDMVNMAARLMQVAATARIKDQRPATSDEDWDGDEAWSSVLGPWSILCDEATFQAAQARIAFEVLPPVAIKGKSDAVAVYRPTHPETTQSRSHILRSKIDIVGRAAERAALAEQLQALLRGGNGGVVLVEGDAGMGKSHLLENLRRLAETLRISVFTGAADAMEQSTPYYAWRNVFDRMLDLDVLGSVDDRRKHVLNLLEDRDDLLPHAPLLNAVLSLNLPDNELTGQMSGQVRADHTRDLLLRLLRESAARSPKLLILEDAHWFDSASWALAQLAAERVRPLLLVIAMRPPASATQPSMPGEYRRLRDGALLHLRLDALTSAEAELLVCRRLGVGALAEPVAELIREKAQGNPFFSEELAFALRDAGLLHVAGGVADLAHGADVHALAFPETVQAAIMSRIDRLSPTQQLALKVASVIGRVFAFRILEGVFPLESERARLADELAALAKLDITPLDTPEPELAYSFKHAITQDVVYNLMLFAQRRQLHRAVAEWYERAYTDEPWLYPLLAYHWSKADDVLRALAYLQKAGEHALAISALREARMQFAQAVALAGDMRADSPEQSQRRSMTLTRLMGETHHLLGELAAARVCFGQSLALALLLGDRKGAAEALSRLGRLDTDAGAYAVAREQLEEALALARELDDRPVLAHVLNNLGNVAVRQGVYAEAEGYYQEGLVIATALGDRSSMAFMLNGLGNTAVDQKAYDEALYCYRESLAIRRALGDRWGVGASHSNLGWLAHLQGRYAEARTNYEEALAIYRAIGDQRGAALALVNLGFTRWELGEFARAAESLFEALRLAMSVGATPLALESLAGIARLRARDGQLEHAAELLGLALNHPASSAESHIQAAPVLAELRARLAPERLDAAIERGKTADLGVIAGDLLGDRIARAA
jgi:predicted ATPase/class 3 adenylate cyclase